MSKLILNVLPVPLIFISFRCFDKFFIEHMGIQFILFTILAGIPSTITGCMFYVDVAWPWGLVALSIFSHTSDWGDNTNSLRQTLACGMMFLHGIRMALGGTFMILSGVWSPKKGDIQRYEYQKIRYKKEGKVSEVSRNAPCEIRHTSLTNLFNYSIPFTRRADLVVVLDAN